MSVSPKISKLSSDAYKKLSTFSITYGVADTKYGKSLIAVHEKSICYLSFFDTSCNLKLDDVKRAFPNAQLTEDDAIAQTYADKTFGAKTNEVNVLLKGTDFQLNVWQELIKLKKGSTASYEDVAVALGNPKAIRAVANAVAKNNVSYLIPCHRVIRKTGALGKYGGGQARKLEMLKDENAI